MNGKAANICSITTVANSFARQCCTICQGLSLSNTWASLLLEPFHSTQTSNHCSAPATAALAQYCPRMSQDCDLQRTLPMNRFTRASLLPASAQAGGRRRRPRDLARKRVHALPDAQVAVVAAGRPVRARMPAAGAGPRVHTDNAEPWQAGHATCTRCDAQVEAVAGAEVAEAPGAFASHRTRLPALHVHHLSHYLPLVHVHQQVAKHLRPAVAAASF